MSSANHDWLQNAVIQYETAILRMCYAYLGDLQLAEDAVQETFLKAWRHRERFRGEASEKTYLTGIAINVCKDIRRSAYWRRVDRSAALDSLPEGDVPFSAPDDTVTRAVMLLPPRLREVILLHAFQQLTVAETAQALHTSLSTVYSRLQKAHSLLKNELEDWYHDR